MVAQVNELFDGGIGGRFASGDHLSAVASIVVAVVVVGGFLALANRRLRKMDVP